MAELYDILKNIQTSPKLLMGGSGGTASVDEDGKIIVPSLNVGPNQRITANESGADTTISVKSGGAAGSAAIFLLKSDGSLRVSLFYDESSDKILFQSASGDMDFQVPAAKFFSFLKSGPDTEKIMRLHVLGTNGGFVDFFITDRDPSGNIVGNPGDLAFRSDGVNSRQYIHEGSASSNDDWAEISTMPPGETGLHTSSIHDLLTFVDGSTQSSGSTPDGIGWHTSTLDFVNFKSVNSQDSQPKGMFVRPNGENVYICGDVTDSIHQLNMSTRWDVLSIADPGFNVPAEGNNPRALFWSPFGTDMFVILANNTLVQFSVNTPWDINAASENGTVFGLAVSTATSMWWHPSGKRFYIRDSSDLVKEFILENSWDINTPPTGGKTFDAAFSGGMVGFDPTGTIMYLSDGTNIYEYDLDGWDLDTPTLNNTTPHGLTSPSAITLKPDGTKFFVLDMSTDNINEFNLGILSSSKVGIGTDAPVTILDIQAGGPTITVRNTADFGRSDVYLYGSRNAGAGNAELGSLTMFNTRSGSDVQVARLAFVNGQSGTSAGGINFLTKENADGSLSVRLSIDDAGRVLINGEDASRIAPTTVEVFTETDLDPIAAGDVITIDGITLVLELKASITSTKRFNIINGGVLSMRFSGGVTTWAYSGSSTFITVNSGRILVRSGIITGNSSATLFDVTAAPTVSFNSTTVLFFGSYGTIRETGLVLMDSNGFFAGNGTLQLIDNDVTSINNIGLGTATPVSGAIILVSGRKTGFFDLSTWNVTLQSGESLLRLDPYAPNLSSSLTKIRVIGGDLFDTDGSTGAFTAVADASIGPQGISVVSDAGGIASFNFTPGPVVYVGQEVTLSGYVTNTAYNGTFIVSDAGVGVFEIAEIPFGTDEASGSFSGDSITLTDTATTLANGDTLVIDTDGPTDYDGGAAVYNKQTNSFQINRTFTSTHAGSWDTAGINERDPRVLANSNPGFVDSKSIAFGDINAHAVTNSITDGTYLELGPSGMVQRPSTERFKLIIDSGRWEYTGNEPFEGLLTAAIFATKSGSTANYRFSLSINSAIPNFANAPYTPIEVKTTKVGVTMLAPISLVKGDHFQIYIAGDGSGDDITVTDLLMSIQ